MGSLQASVARRQVARRTTAGQQRRTTAQRGLGWADHQQPRQAALAAFRPGQPCFRCALNGVEHPLPAGLISRSADGRRLIAPLLELDEDPPRALRPPGTRPQQEGLSYRRCNRRHGSALGNQIKRLLRPPSPPAYTRW